MLDRTFSISRTITPALHYNQFQLPLPTSDEALLRPQQIRDLRQNALSDSDADSDIGICAINTKVFSLWNDVLQYVFRSPPKSNSPPVSTLYHLEFIPVYLNLCCSQELHLLPSCPKQLYSGPNSQKHPVKETTNEPLF
jgi:hypothetical protein